MQNEFLIVAKIDYIGDEMPIFAASLTDISNSSVIL